MINQYLPDNFEVSNYENTIQKRKKNYNEFGFRGDSIKKSGFKVMSIGCSLTEGVAVSEKQTWTYQFCKFIPNSINLNFGKVFTNCLTHKL